MKFLTREIEIDLTPEQEPIWDHVLSGFIGKSTTIREYYDSPISPSVKGKARMPYDFDVIFELLIFFKQFDDADPKIRNEICQQLGRVWDLEKMI